MMLIVSKIAKKGTLSISNGRANGLTLLMLFQYNPIANYFTTPIRGKLGGHNT
jgi:hypothetical protein